MKQITKKEDLIGKKIVNVTTTSESELMMFTFENDECVILDVHGYDFDKIRLLNEFPSCINELIELEIITEEEGDKRRLEADKLSKEREEKQDRATYERLKVRFEGK